MNVRYVPLFLISEDGVEIVPQHHLVANVVSIIQLLH